MSSSKPSITELRARAQPPSVLDRRNAEHWAGRLYMRRISIYVTWALLRTGVSANVVTFVMALVGVAGALQFRSLGVRAGVLGVVLIQLYLLLDCSDGEIARIRGTTGATGIFLDRLGHFVVEAALIASVGWAASDNQSLRGLDGSVITMDIRPPSSGWMLAALIAALIHVSGKLQTDLVEVARAKAGLAPVTDDAETARPRASGLAMIRRLATLVPLYRLTGAIEASILAMTAIILDRLRYQSPFASRALVVLFLVSAIYTFVGHLVGILASNRLRA